MTHVSASPGESQAIKVLRQRVLDDAMALGFYGLPSTPEATNALAALVAHASQLGESVYRESETARATLILAIRREREACAVIAQNERVDAEATDTPEDEAYNLACDHIAEAIRARTDDEDDDPLEGAFMDDPNNPTEF